MKSTPQKKVGTSVMRSDTETALAALAEQILKLQGYETLDPESFNAFRDRLVSRAEDYINISLIKALSESEQAEFGELLEGDDIVAQELYLREHIENIEDVIADALKRFYTDYTDDTADGQ